MDEPNFSFRKRIFKPKTPTKTRVITDTLWYGLDLRNNGLKNLSLNLFDNKYIYELNLENNKLEFLPGNIKNLKNLEILNISNNRIKTLPPELGRLTNLREIYASKNLIKSLPTDFGTLFNCEKFDLDDNPLEEPFATQYKQNKGRGVIDFCREHHTTYPSPMERHFISLEDGQETNASNFNKFSKKLSFSLGSFNLLTNYCANEQVFGYVPSWVLKWANRKEKLLDEVVKYNFDILCTQEMQTSTFSEYFRGELEARCEYDSLFYPKGRAKSWGNNAGQVDGCATFWKKRKFVLIEHKCIEFLQVILNDKRFNENVDIINRNMSKDNIALITVLKGEDTLLIVVNPHIYWDPDFKDVKLLQCVVLLEEITKFKFKYPKAGIIIGGDFNSLYDSDTYKLITTGRLEPHCKDFDLYNYNLLSNNGFIHSLNLKDTYKQTKSDKDKHDVLTFTNYTPHFMGIIDYIFFNERLQCVSFLSGIDESYRDNVVGLPSIHLPSDHIIIGGKYNYKLENKIKK